jgi:polysaccharide deacetylase family protein (PEP-CTERM system associated)
MNAITTADHTTSAPAALPFISVIVPVRNEAAFIGATLDQLLTQDYPAGRFEVLVADGRSDDDTRAIVTALARRHANLRLVDNPRRWSSAGRNVAAQAARGNVVLLIDGHCEIANRRYLSNLAEAFRASGADCVGRPQPLDVAGASSLQRAIACARSSRLGHHPASHIWSDREGYVAPDSVAVAYRRDVFDRVGWFDESFDACEDVEFNHRLARAGLRCWFTPRVRVRYHPRDSLPRLFRQMTRYGRGRVRLLRKHPDTFSLPGFVPGAFVAGLLLGPALACLFGALWYAYAGAVALYAAIVLGTSLSLAIREREPSFAGWLPLVFATVHVGAGWGLLLESCLSFRAFLLRSANSLLRFSSQPPHPQPLSPEAGARGAGDAAPVTTALLFPARAAPAPVCKPEPTSARWLNALTIDVEDYYHVSAFDGAVGRADWDAMESRVGPTTERLLDLLAAADVRATFFVLGWVAQRQPSLVRAIRAAGHEVGCHSYAHRLIYTQTPDEFRADLRRGIRVLEDAIGEPVTLYRAPSFSITRESAWALDVLIEEGIRVDSSIYPTHHDRYGIPGTPLGQHRIDRSAGRLWEFPPPVWRCFGYPLPVGGGGYFRLYPYAMTRLGLRRINEQGRPFAAYLHPWELDPAQPRIRAGLGATFRHRVNLGRTEGRLTRLLADFPFGTLSEALACYDPAATEPLPQRRAA